MEFVVGKKILIKNPDEKIKQYCKNQLILKNPDYYKKKRMGKWVGNTPAEIVLYEKYGNDLLLPFGCFSDLWKLHSVKEDFKSDIKPFSKMEYGSKIELYSYQKKAVNQILKKKNGVVVMPCGSGKTQTALQAIAMIGGRSLWLTHTKDLLNQSLDRARSVFNLSKNMYGKITDGKVDLGSHITFATVQTMSNLDLSEMKRLFDVVVVDECHKAVGSPTKMMQFYKVLSNLSARYKIGLTATPYRSDGLEKCMFALLGNKICEISQEDVQHTTCPVEIWRKDTGFQPDMRTVLSGDGTLNYTSLIDNLISDESRFEKVLNIVNVFGKAERTLVLANRVKYLERLQKEFIKNGGKGICLSGLSNSKSGLEARKHCLNRLNNREVDCIFATYQLAKEGLDIPQLRHVIFATPEKDKTTVTQAAGRVGRKAEGKDKGMVIDLVDDFGMYLGWWKERKRIYRSSGYEVMNDE